MNEKKKALPLYETAPSGICSTQTQNDSTSVPLS